MENCLFCRIIKGGIPAEIVYQDDWVLAFRDIHPIAPIHILIIPKKHITSLNDLTESLEDAKMIGRLILVAKQLAQQEKIADKGYKLLLRTGKDGGQEIGHLHWHLIGGAPLFEDIHSI